MEYKETNKDSKYLFYIVDNKSQMTDMSEAFEQLGGTKVYTAEIAGAFEKETPAVILSSVFMITSPCKEKIRVFYGHGISDKPVAKFKPPRNFIAEDYYFVSGLKQAWNLEHYSHQLAAPYDKNIKTGVPSSDLFCNPGKDLRKKKDELKAKYGIKTDRPIVLYSPSFQSTSLEFYYRLFIKSFEKDYFLIIRRHDRETSFSALKNPNVFDYRGFDHPAELIAISDYYIGEGSSVDNVAIFADIPIVMAKPTIPFAGDVPCEFDMRNFVPYFEVATSQSFPSITEQIKLAGEPEWVQKRHEYIKNSFYFTDGKCMDRFLNAIKALVELLKRRMAGERDRRQEQILTIWDTQIRNTRYTSEEEKPDDIKFKEMFTDLT